MPKLRLLVIRIAGLAAMVAATSPSDAATVKYYSRQVLNHLSTAPTYSATYGAYGACSGGTQTAPIASCVRSDGQTVDNSLCSPQAKTQSCVSYDTCGSLTANQWSSQTSNGTNIGSSVTSLAAAQSGCASYVGKLTTPGTCAWNKATSILFWYPNLTVGPISGSNAANDYAAYCTNQ